MSLGPYAILAPLGAGGMGHVFRAHDPRLGREVAIKVLPASLSDDAEMLRRLEQEARAAGALNHPNILAVYDVGTHEGAPYVVSELLEGSTLRERLAGGALPTRKAIDCALPIARGLAAAHEKGIVHRDLKPENLFITKDGRIKILDFGLAKVLRPMAPHDAATGSLASEVGTAPGVILGTIGYMSPEQVRGRPADHRTDLFSFGVVLYEMLAGQRAFKGETPADTLTAILTKDPPDLATTSPDVSPMLERIVRRCLEKEPEARFRSAHDLAFALETLSGVSDPLVAGRLPAVAPPRRAGPVALLAGLAVAALLAAAYFTGRQARGTSPAQLPSFHRLTFRQGYVQAARFAPDGQTIVYAGAWQGRPVEVFSTRLEGPESRPLGLPKASLDAVSRSGELAVLFLDGTLARVPLGGGTPRAMLENVLFADWGPDGKSLAVVRSGAKNSLQYPAGTVLYETGGWISDPRVSPRGELVAFLDHPSGDVVGSVAVVDRARHRRTLSRTWSSASGLAWSPSGDEIWFTASEAGGAQALYAVALDGRQRLLARTTDTLRVLDVHGDGRVLLARDTSRMALAALAPGEARERDFSWLDYSQATDISADGKTILFVEGGEGGGAGSAAYLRRVDEPFAVHLGDGLATALSPDGKRAVEILRTSPPQLVLLPTGAGEPAILPRGSIEEYHWARWFPDGRRVVFTAHEPGRGKRVYVQAIDGGGPRPITPEGTDGTIVSPDGTFVAAMGPGGRTALYPVAGGEPRPVPGIAPGEWSLGWSADGRSMYVWRPGWDTSLPALPAQVYRLDLPTGRRELWKELMPADRSGLMGVNTVWLTPDAAAYAYSFTRALSDLYLVEGLR